MKTLIAATGFVVIMAINPILAAIYIAAILVAAAAYYLFKALAWLLTPAPKHDDQVVVGYEGPWIAEPIGQTKSTVFYGSKHRASDKPYQHQNGQTGPPEA